MKFIPKNPERRIEIRFSLSLAALAIFAVIFAESILRVDNFLSKKFPDFAPHFPKGETFDWVAFREQGGYEEPSTSRFRMHPNKHFMGVTTNSYGFRGPELELPKPNGRVRLIFAGDSTTLAVGLRDDQTLPAKITAALNAKEDSCSYDYIAVSGPEYNFSDLSELIERETKNLDADIVLAIHPGISQWQLHKLMRPDSSVEKLPTLPGGLRFLEKFKLFWFIREAQINQIFDTLRAYETPGEIKSTYQTKVAGELQGLVDAADGRPFFYFQTYGSIRSVVEKEEWAVIAKKVLQPYENTIFSTSLEKVPPTRDMIFNKSSHYTSRGIVAATRIIISELEESNLFYDFGCG